MTTKDHPLHTYDGLNTANYYFRASQQRLGKSLPNFRNFEEPSDLEIFIMPLPPGDIPKQKYAMIGAVSGGGDGYKLSFNFLEKELIPVEIGDMTHKRKKLPHCGDVDSEYLKLVIGKENLPDDYDCASLLRVPQFIADNIYLYTFDDIVPILLSHDSIDELTKFVDQKTEEMVGAYSTISEAVEDVRRAFSELVQSEHYTTGFDECERKAIELFMGLVENVGCHQFMSLIDKNI